MYRLHFPFPLACHMPAFIRLDGLLLWRVLFSTTRSLLSWVRIPPEAGCACVVLCRWSPCVRLNSGPHKMSINKYLTRQAMYVQTNTVARSRNSCAVQKHEILHILCMCVCVYVCVCNFSYPAFKTHASYYIVIFGLYGSTIFFNINFIKGTIVGKMLPNIKWYSLQLCLKRLSL
jgi:hypothetical protein